MSDTSPPAGQSAQSQASSGIARLARMSTTAGVGLQEYRAINPLAVASLVLGAASLLVWLHPLLYVLPGLAILMGAVALWQISRSNRTQGGTVLAGLGLVLGIGFGGLVLANEVHWRLQVAQYRDEIEETFQQFGAALARGDYDGAYAMTTDGFKAEIDRERFERQIRPLGNVFGRLESAGSNRLAVVNVDGAGRVTAEAMLIIHYSELNEPHRQPVRLARTEEGWLLQQLPVWFPYRT